MARKPQRQVSLSRATYLKLKAFCEANHVSMAQVVETRVNEYLDKQPEDLLNPVEEHAP